MDLTPVDAAALVVLLGLVLLPAGHMWRQHRELSALLDKAERLNNEAQRDLDTARRILADMRKRREA